MCRLKRNDIFREGKRGENLFTGRHELHVNQNFYLLFTRAGFVLWTCTEQQMTKLLKLTVMYSVCGGDFYSNGNLVSLVALSQLLKGEPASSGQRNIVLKHCRSKDRLSD